MTIFIDMDEVLADTYAAHVERYNRDFGASLTLEECEGREVWQCVPREHIPAVRGHCHLPGFFRTLRPIEGAVETVRELSSKNDIYIASAAMEFHDSLKEKAEWLDEHFPFIPWHNRILCGYKHILLGDVLIDDRKKNLMNFRGRGLLYSSPHNVQTNGFERVNNWEEVAKILL